MEKKYWQSFGELNQSEAFQKTSANEFQEPLLPLEDLDNGMLDAKSPRRDFLKYLGFSTAAATLAASCQTPVRKSVPFLQKPEDIVLGVANYYASTYVSEGDVQPVIVKQRDGRPIKLEGNTGSKITGGGTSARSQASVLDLYDTTRLRHPKEKAGEDFKEVPKFDVLDKTIADKLAALAGKPVVLLTSTLNSPSTAQVVAEFLAKYPGSRHVQYDAVSYSGMLLANEACYGKRALPSYHFDNAKVIISLGADFLGTWLSPVEFTYQYQKNRKVSGDKPEMSRHIQFESHLSLTGSNADDRFVHKPSEKAAVALNILAKLNGSVTAPAISDAALNKGIDLAVAQLKANAGASLVVSGSNDVNLQIIVNAINEAVGANGKTINWAVNSNYRKGVDADFTTLVNDINAGDVGALLIYDTNPVYTYADGKKLGDAIEKLPLTISFNGTLDETTERCKYVIPAHHWLESWGDAEPKTGYYSLIQPTINPLFKTRPFQTSLLKWSGSAMDYDAYFKDFWSKKLGTAEAYYAALQTGVMEPADSFAGAAFSSAKLAEAAAKLSSEKRGGNYEVVLYQKVGMGTGSQANNPWLQEMPDPISKVTWDNYAMVSPALYKKIFGKDVVGSQRDGDHYEVTPEKPVLKVKVGAVEKELPTLVIPGIHPEVVAVAVGYGRSSKDPKNTKDRIGMSANGGSVNAYPFVTFDGTGFRYSAAASVEKSSKPDYALAQTQVHGSAENRPVIYETNLQSFIADPSKVLQEATHERAMLLHASQGEDFARDATMYPQHDKPGVKWGMSIDLTSCTGCSACVIACTAENNVAVVGKTQVVKAHEMHWLRIDRYFTGDVTNPDVVFQPMLCQHCDNAPCENVCPVAATNHSSEGLNQMTYNRCIGTRYCANNCPFKVRRFNWLDYTGADSFPDNQNPLLGVDLDDVTLQMNDELTRMVLNPDVTVRSRGVIEKCSFCVQRLQENKLAAKKAQDPTLVRNVQTACSQACPGGCITFGNVNDPESEVSKARADKNRTFYVLESLHVLPNVSYMAKIKNTDRHVTNEIEEAEEGGHDEKAAEKHTEKAHG